MARDFAAEYAKRKTRAEERGLSVSQARGHPRINEQPLRTAAQGFMYHPVLEEGLKQVRDGATLHHAAASVHVSTERLRRYMTDAAMDRHRIDLWASVPATGPAPLGLGSTGDATMNLPWTHAGVPAITLPAGTVDGLPVGLQLAGRFGADEEFLAAAEAIDGVIGETRRMPKPAD